MREIPSDTGPGAIEVSDFEMRQRLVHCGAGLDAIDAESVALDRAMDAAQCFEPVTPDAQACAAATTNEMFTRANAR